MPHIKYRVPLAPGPCDRRNAPEMRKSGKHPDEERCFRPPDSPQNHRYQTNTPMKKDVSGPDIGVEGGQEATGPDRRKRRSSGGEYPCRGHPIPRRFLQPQPVRAGSSFRFRVPLPARNQQASFLRRGVPCVWTPYSPPVFIRSKQGLRVGAVASQEAIEPDRGEACGSRNRGGRRPGSCLTAPTEESKNALLSRQGVQRCGSAEKPDVFPPTRSVDSQV